MATATEPIISEEQLMDMLRSRNVRAVELLYDQHSCMLYGIIYRMINDAKRAEEILFKTFTYIWNHYNHFEDSQQSLSLWMISITRQLTLKASSPLDRLNAEIRLLSLLQNGEREEKKIALELAFLQGLSVLKIAKKLGCSESAVKTFLHQATMELKNEFSKK